MGVIDRKIGSLVEYSGESMRVVGNCGFGKITLLSKNNEYFDVNISELATESATKTKKIPSDPIRAKKVPAYLEAFKDVLDPEARTRAKVTEAGDKVGKSTSAAYEALRRYDLSGDTSELPPYTPPGGRNKMRLKPESQKIIQQAIDKLVQGRTLTRRNFVTKTRKTLEEKGLKVADSTLRSIYNRVGDYPITRAQKGRADASRELDPKPGHHPGAVKPLHIVQIDHWKIDVEILDETRLHVIGRCWLTVAIDIYSRMIWGWHVGLDAPGNLPLAMCMISGLTLKDSMLKNLGLDYEIPIAGKVDEIHADNAKEFTGNTIKSGCEAYNITLKWRPLGAPQYGQFIERYNGTLASKLKEVPGSTGSNPAERKILKPEKTAAFDLLDIVKHICMVINEYHNEVHQGIGMTPLEKFKSYYFHPDGRQKHRLPKVLVDDLKLRLNWYPIGRRSVRQTGIRIDYLDYYDGSIRWLVRNRKNLKGKQVRIRRDPFDIRHIYLEHPDSKQWIEVRVSHIGCPVASLFQLREAARTARRKKLEPTPENLFKFIRDQQQHIDEAQKATKTARREAERRKHHKAMRQKAPTDQGPASKQAAQPTTAPASSSPQASEDMRSILAGLTKQDIEKCL